MTQINIVEAQAHSVHGLVLIEPSGTVWLTFPRPWWDLATYIWWWLYPGAKRWVVVHQDNGKKVRVRAVRVFKNVRIGDKA